MPDSDIGFRVSQVGAEKVAQDFKEIDGSLYNMQKAGSAATAALANFNEAMRNNAPTSQAYLLAQENRNAVLSAMTPIQNKEIAATKTSTRGLGTLTSTLLRSVAGTGKFSSEVSVLTTALVGGAGLTAGLAVAVGIVTLITQQFSKGGFAIDDYIKKIEDLKNESELLADATNKVSESLDKLTNQQMISRISTLKSELSNLWTLGLYGMGFGRQAFAEMQLMLKQLSFALGTKNIMTTYGGDSYAEGIKKQISYYTFLRDEQAKTRAEFIMYNAEVKKYSDLLKIQEEKTKKTTKSTSEYAKALNELYKELIKVLSALPPPRGDIKFRGLVKGVPVPAKPTIEFSEEEEEYFSRLNDMAYITAGVLRDEFTKAWQDVFGEANSLFESFAQRISQYFADLALRYVALNLVSTIFGVPLNVITGGGAAGNSPSPSPNSLNKPSYNIILDGEIVGKFVDDRVPYSVNKATRLNII